MKKLGVEGAIVCEKDGSISIKDSSYEPLFDHKKYIQPYLYCLDYSVSGDTFSADTLSADKSSTAADWFRFLSQVEVLLTQEGVKKVIAEDVENPKLATFLKQRGFTNFEPYLEDDMYLAYDLNS